MLPKIYKLNELKELNPEINLCPCSGCGSDPVVIDDGGEFRVQCQKCGRGIPVKDGMINVAGTKAYRQWNALNSPPQEEFTPEGGPYSVPVHNCCANCSLNHKCTEYRRMDASQMYSSICRDYLF